MTTIDGVNYLQPHPNYLLEADGLSVRNKLHMPDAKVQVYDLQGIGDAFYRFTVGENALNLDIMIKEKGGFKLFDKVLNKKGTPEEISTLFASILKRLKKP
ncbi:MAG: hypothetical protein LBJ74_00650 [Heliobacteriaceae bacterium]|jgi:hypothetical protein|nr:hypothetical protein [Heliobacteriaceae bacterium]